MGTCFSPSLEIWRECATATRLVAGNCHQISPSTSNATFVWLDLECTRLQTTDIECASHVGRSRRKAQPPISCSASSDLQQVHALCTLSNPTNTQRSNRIQSPSCPLFPHSGLLSLPSFFHSLMCTDKYVLKLEIPSPTPPS